MNTTFRFYASQITDLVPRARHVECLALLAKMLKAHGVNLGDEENQHPNSKRSRDRDFTPEERAEIEQRKAEVRAGWTPADYEERKSRIV